MHVKLMEMFTRETRTRGNFAVMGLGKTWETVDGKPDDELTISIEQADSLWRWLGHHLHGIKIEVTSVR